jgi:hypothetical protein
MVARLNTSQAQIALSGPGMGGLTAVRLVMLAIACKRDWFPLMVVLSNYGKRIMGRPELVQ